MRVIATKLGYDGRDLRQEGEEFDMPDDAKGSWFEPVKPAEKPTAKARAPKGDDLT